MTKWKGPPHEEISRCGAKTRSGGTCGHYSMTNGRCRYHGGKSTGAKNPAVTHGMYSKVGMEERYIMYQLIKGAKKLVTEIS